MGGIQDKSTKGDAYTFIIERTSYSHPLFSF